MEAQRLWASKAPERVSPVRVDASWDEAIRRTGVEAEPLLIAVTNAVRRDPDFKRGKAMNLDRWLDENRFLPWLTDADDAAPARVVWAGPAEVRTAVVAAMGEPGAVSYLDGARWDRDNREIVTRTALARDRLSAARPALRALGVFVRAEVRHG